MIDRLVVTERLFEWVFYYVSCSVSCLLRRVDEAVFFTYPNHPFFNPSTVKCVFFIRSLKVFPVRIQDMLITGYLLTIKSHLDLCSHPALLFRI